MTEVDLRNMPLCACGEKLVLVQERERGQCLDCIVKGVQMIEEHIQKKCKECGRKHDAPGNVCFICMRNAITDGSTPQRVGTARKGDLVILEYIGKSTPEDRCRIADLLGQIREDLGIRFLVLDPTACRVTRIADISAIQNLDELDKMLKEAHENAGRTDSGT